MTPFFRGTIAVKSWYQLESQEVLKLLDSDSSRGLREVVAAVRFAQSGPNQLVDRGVKKAWRIFWEQLTAPLVVILIVAAAISSLLGDRAEAIAILTIVILNALLGFSQEYRSEKAMAALKALVIPSVSVVRDGQLVEISARQLVPGDVVLLEAGNLVPADCRLLECVSLQTQEAPLTGESEPVEKGQQALNAVEIPLGDRRNMVYMGTSVIYGRGRAIVTETGMNTELGRIANLMQAIRSQSTPLQRRLDRLGNTLVLAALGLVIAIFGLGLLRGEDLKLMFLTSVSLAVAAVPEGLPAVVTIALALGAQRLLKQGVLIRRLPAVETLGSVTTICSDKTGTLTENRMTVAVLDVAGYRLDLTSYLTQPSIQLNSTQSDSSLSEESPAISLLLAGSTLCNNAFLEANPIYSLPFVGDPTEGALVVASAQMGWQKDRLEDVFPRIQEIPFDSNRKRMTTVHQLPLHNGEIPAALEKVWFWSRDVYNASYIAFTKGAADRLIDMCDRIWLGGETEPLGEMWRMWISSSERKLAEEGMRVLGVAFRPLKSFSNHSADFVEDGAIFIGLVGMSDPIRPEVKNAILTCKTAGIRPVMITGDHPITAQHIACELSIAEDGHLLTGMDLENMSAEQLLEEVKNVSIFARVTPKHKLNIVTSLQKYGQVVAMTGDGVNDAPALKKADIGVAMGVSGTDVAKEAADMALLDDNFATIVAAVQEGRVIYDNIRKFIKYLLGSNSGEIWVMLIAPFLGMPLPLLPLQILWINLLTDGMPALALGVEPVERIAMLRPPYPPRESIFARGMGYHVIWVGLLMALVSLGIGFSYWRSNLPSWQTMVFTLLTLSQLGHSLAIRSERDSLFQIGWFSNRALLGAVLLTLVLQLAAIYLPFLQHLLGTTSLSLKDLAVCLGLSTIVFWGVEVEKLYKRNVVDYASERNPK